MNPQRYENNTQKILRTESTREVKSLQLQDFEC